MLEEDQNINLYTTYNKNKMGRIMGVVIHASEQQIFRKISSMLSNFFQK